MLVDVAVIALVLGPVILLIAAIVGLVGTVELWSTRRRRAHSWLAVSFACVTAVALMWTLGTGISFY